MDLTDPAFPHGENRGYVRGCRNPADCPAEATCTEAHRLEGAKWRQRHGGSKTAPAERLPLTTYVRRRLSATIDAVGLEAVVERTGVTAEQIDAVLTSSDVYLAWDLARPLDAAWSWFVKGSDTLAPDFQHGRGVTSYTTGACRCAECAEAQRRANRIQRGDIGVRPWARCTPAQTRAVAKHLAPLAATFTPSAIARAANTSSHTTNKAIRGEQIVRGVAVRLLALTATDVAAARGQLPIAEASHIVGTLCALGYSAKWQSRRIGRAVSDQHISRIARREGAWISAGVMASLRALAAEVGDREATPGPGLPLNSITHARNYAARLGYYVPAAYDDDGNLDLRSIPGHKWAVADDWCGARVEANYRLSLGWTHAEAGKIAGISLEAMHKRPKHGLIYDDEGNLNHKASWDRIKQFADVYHRYENHQIGAVAAAIELDVIRADFRTYWLDHPDVVAWVEAERAQPAEGGETASSTRELAA